MCSSRQIMDPLNLIFNPKTAKYADPLGLTKTAVGDPTGRFRKEHAEVAKEQALANHRTPSSVAYRTLLADGSETLIGGPPPRQQARSPMLRLAESVVQKRKGTLLSGGGGG